MTKIIRPLHIQKRYVENHYDINISGMAYRQGKWYFFDKSHGIWGWDFTMIGNQWHIYEIWDMPSDMKLAKMANKSNCLSRHRVKSYDKRSKNQNHVPVNIRNFRNKIKKRGTFIGYAIFYENYGTKLRPINTYQKQSLRGFKPFDWPGDYIRKDSSVYDTREKGFYFHRTKCYSHWYSDKIIDDLVEKYLPDDWNDKQFDDAIEKVKQNHSWTWKLHSKNGGWV